MGVSPQQAITRPARPLIVARPLPDTDAFGAMHHRGVHGQPLRERVFTGHDDVDVVPAAQAVIENR